jgi:YggT family protein
MVALLTLISNAVNLYVFVLLVAVVLSWLIAFNVVNPYNRAVAMVNDFAQRLTEPALRPFRRLMQRKVPSLQVDVSPIILILLLNFAVNLMWELYGSVAH